ncbi:DNA-binding transcriptional regulator PaaX [Lysinibacillus sp. RC79]
MQKAILANRKALERLVDDGQLKKSEDNKKYHKKTDK